MSDVSANPADLDSFVARADAIATQLGESIAHEQATFLTFAHGAGSGVGPDATALVGRAQDLCDEIAELGSFVALVHDALQLADNDSLEGTITIAGAEMADLMRRAAEDADVEHDSVIAVDHVVEATVPVVGTVPADSGWVGDPVLTATGHFVIDEIDVPMPDRLAVLQWNRTYASIDDTDVGLGRGWFSWLNAALAASSEAIAVTDQFGRSIGLTTDPHVSDRFASGDSSVVAQRVDDGFVVHWGRRSAHAYETWRFDTDGHLRTVAGETIGTTRFERTGQRLVALEHDSGRTLALRWQDGRLVGLDASDGRSAHFEVAGGRLLGVRSPGCVQRYRHDAHGRIDAVIDADGVTLVELRFDDRGRAVEQREHTGGVSRFEYVGRRTFVSDVNGVRRAGYLHDDQGRVIVATGAPVEPLTRQFDGAGRTVRQTNPDGTRCSMTVEPVEPAGGRRAAAHSDPIGLRETLVHTGDEIEIFEYDGLERIRRYSRNGHEMTYRYVDESVLPTRIEARGGWFIELTWHDGCLARVVDADGVTSTFEHDAAGDIVASVDGLGNRTEFERHMTGQPSLIRHADGATTVAQLDDAGRTLSITDEAGGTIAFELSPAGRLNAVTDPTGGHVRLRYDEAGLPVEIVDAAGFAIGVGVDDDHRPTTLTLPDGSTRRIERDVAGRIVALRVADRSPIGERSRVWSIERDSRRSAVTYASPGGRDTVFTSQLGAVAHHTMRAGDTEQHLVVDSERMETVLTDTRGSTWSSSIDVDAHRITGLEPDGTVTTRVYTPAGRIRQIVEHDRSVRFDYDAAGRVRARDDGHGPWRFERNPRGRIVAIESPQGRRRTFTYDEVGRLIRSAIGGAVTRQDFDPSGRLIRTTYPDGAISTYEWGVRSELLRSTDRAGGVTRYEYDERRRLVAMIDPIGGRTHVEYAFDDVVASVTDPSGNRREFAHDHDGLLLVERDGDRELGYELDDRGRRTLIELRSLDGAVRHRLVYERDAAGSVSAVYHDGARLGSVSSDRADDLDLIDVRLTYDLDGLGYRTESDDFERTIGRDGAGRRNEIVDRMPDVVRMHRVIRDDAGRVIAHEDRGARTEYGFHPSGFLASAGDPAGSTTWDYDVAGRLIVENGPFGRREFRYDAAHRLVESSGAGGHTWFGYDAAGRRTSASGAVERSYDWDLTGLRSCSTESGRVEFERDEFGRVVRVSTPREVTDIVWRRTSGFATPLAIGDAQLISDGASVAAIRAADGTMRPVPEQAGPWGELRDVDEFEVAWHPFHGLTVAGLVVLGERVYDIATRQFLSPDRQQPIVGMASSGWTYCYAANDPVGLLDPLGLAPLSYTEFERIQRRYTSVQWGNVAKVAIVVTAIALTPTGAGPLVVAGFAAAGAGGGEMAKQIINNEIGVGEQGYYPGRVVKETIVAAAGGYVGARFPIDQLRYVGPYAEQAMQTAGGRAAVNFTTGTIETTAVEVYDAVGGPGADGAFDVDEIFWGGVGAVIGGEVFHRLQVRADSPSAQPELPTTPVEPRPSITGPPPVTADVEIAGAMPSPTSTGAAIVPYERPVTALVPWEPPVTDLVPVLPPIRVNVDSGIYHVVGGAHYDRLVNPSVVEVRTVLDAIGMGARPSRN